MLSPGQGICHYYFLMMTFFVLYSKNTENKTFKFFLIFLYPKNQLNKREKKKNVQHFLTYFRWYEKKVNMAPKLDRIYFTRAVSAVATDS